MHALIDALDEIQTYTPANYSGTTNRKLVSREDCQTFEMIHGTIEPGGAAERHAHETEFQAIYILSGAALVELGDSPGEVVTAGSVVRIPPRTQHYVKSLGPEDLKLLVIYSPPLSV